MRKLVEQLIQTGYADKLHHMTSMFTLIVSPSKHALYPEWTGLSLSVLYLPKDTTFVWRFKDRLESGELGRTKEGDAFDKFVHLATRRFNWFDGRPKTE